MARRAALARRELVEAALPDCGREFLAWLTAHIGMPGRRWQHSPSMQEVFEMAGHLALTAELEEDLPQGEAQATAALRLGVSEDTARNRIRRARAAGGL